jgi:hypothetical protein
MLRVQHDFQRRRISVEEAEAEHRLEQIERERQRKGKPRSAKKLRRGQKKAARAALVKMQDPFGGWDKWKALKALMRPGDELWEFCSPKSSWDMLMGVAGYELVRDGVAIAQVIVRMN